MLRLLGLGHRSDVVPPARDISPEIDEAVTNLITTHRRAEQALLVHRYLKRAHA